MTCYRYIFLTLLFLLIGAGSSNAGTLAVFPLLDLTQDANGVNFSLTESVRQKALDDGFEVISEGAIMDFMVRNRIRTLGTLSSYELTKLRKELGAEFVLLGTVCQLDNVLVPKISMSLQLIRTSDNEVIWSRISDLHKDDMISMLGISDPESVNDLYVEYFTTIFEEIPHNVDEEFLVDPFVNLLYVNMRPLYVKPGQKIDLTARFYSSGTKDSPSFFLEHDGRRSEVEIDEDAHFVNTSFLAKDMSGTFKVNLVAIFPSGKKQVLHLGEYTTDDISPELSGHVFGTQIDGDVNFSKELVIVPKLTIPERLSMWEIVVYDEAENPVVTQSGEGQIPAKIFWNGRDDNLELVTDGRYRIVVTVWDRAMNKGSTEFTAFYRHLKPEVVFYVQRDEDVITVEFEDQIKYPMAHWFVKVYKKDGTLVMIRVGEELPQSLEISIPGMSETENLEFIFAAQDVYGNSRYLSYPDFLNLGKKEDLPEIVPETQWLENF